MKGRLEDSGPGRQFLEGLWGVIWPRHLRNELSEAKGFQGTRMKAGRSFQKHQWMRETHCPAVRRDVPLACLSVLLLRSTVTNYSHVSSRALTSLVSHRVQSHQSNSRSGIRSHIMEERGVSEGLITQITTWGGSSWKSGYCHCPFLDEQGGMRSTGDGRTWKKWKGPAAGLWGNLPGLPGYLEGCRPRDRWWSRKCKNFLSPYQPSPDAVTISFHVYGQMPEFIL